MAKVDFFKTWEIYEIRSGTNGEVSTTSSTFCIYDDGGNKVTIQYSGFASSYPVLQNGDYHPLTDSIIAYFADSTYIELNFQSSQETTDYNKLDVVLGSGSSSLHDVFELPEMGEMGAEACI